MDAGIESTKAKLANIQAICEKIYETYDDSTSRHEKLACLKKLLSYQKAFEDIVADMADDCYDACMRLVVSMRLSFDKIDRYAVAFGGIEVVKKETAETGRERSEPQESYNMKEAVRRRTDLEDLAYEEFKDDMKEVHEAEAMDETEKRKAIDKLLEDLKVTSGFTVADQDMHASKFCSDFATRKTDMDKYKKINNEIKRLDTVIKQENDPKKKKDLVKHQQDLKKVEKMVIGLKSVFRALFTSRNPVIRFFGRLFGKKYDKPKRAQAVLAAADD